jgi:hypothetical protein
MDLLVDEMAEETPDRRQVPCLRRDGHSGSYEVLDMGKDVGLCHILQPDSLATPADKLTGKSSEVGAVRSELFGLSPRSTRTWSRNR